MRTTILLVLSFILGFAQAIQAQVNYEPYYFSLVAGTPGSLGSNDGSGTVARLNAPQGIAVDSAGNLYVADTGNDTIRKIAPDSTVSTLAGSAGQAGSADGTSSSARFQFPQGVAVDGSGNVYVADTLNNTIRKINSFGQVTTLAGQAGTAGTLDGNGNVARFSYPIGLAVDSASNVYVADNGNNTIRKITASGEVSTLAGSPGHPGSADGNGASAQFCSPWGISVDGSGNVYVADACNSTIRKVTPAGAVSTLAGLAGSQGNIDGPGAMARFNGPRGVAADTAGVLYVTDTGNNTVRKIGLNGVVTTLGGLAGNSGSSDGVGAASRFNNPHSIVANASGQIYLTDTSNHTIRRAQPAVISLTISTVSNSLSQLSGSAPPDSSIVISTAPDLVSSFSSIATVMADHDGFFLYHEPAGFPKQFYRASISGSSQRPGFVVYTSQGAHR